MNASNAMKSYIDSALRAKVEGADSHRLIHLLLIRAQEKVTEAIVSLENGNLNAKGEASSKAISIVEYLRASLEPGGDPSFATRLADLYSYMERRIFEANAQSDSEGFVEVKGLLREVEEGWSAIPSEYRG